MLPGVRHDCACRASRSPTAATPTSPTSTATMVENVAPRVHHHKCRSVTVRIDIGSERHAHGHRGPDNGDGEPRLERSPSPTTGRSLGSSRCRRLTASPSASMLVTTLPVGSDSVTASYGGGAGLPAPARPPAPASVTVSKASTTLGLLALGRTPPLAGQPVTFTATVFPTTGSGETGMVTFFDNGTPDRHSQRLNGQATLTVTALLAGDDRASQPTTTGTAISSAAPPMDHSPRWSTTILTKLSRPVSTR